MNEQIIKGIGTFDLEKVKVENGEIEIYMPLDKMETSTDQILEKCLCIFQRRNPDVIENNIMWDLRLIFSFGRNEPIFTLGVYMWNKEDEERTMEFYNGFNITIRKDDSKLIKRLLWEHIGQVFLGI